MKTRSYLALAVLLLRLSFAQYPGDQRFAEAERQIVRLAPNGFPEIPRNVVRELKQRGCTIPQEAFTKKRNNVIQGEFARRGQRDLAVLCSIKGMSTILVFWNKSERNPAAIARFEDTIFLQDMLGGKIGFSRAINPVGRNRIMSNYQAYGGPKPPLITHQGIDDAFLEKASTVYYFYKGKWLQLAGAD